MKMFWSTILAGVFFTIIFLTSEVNALACANPSQIMFRMSAESNAHTEVFSQTPLYSYDVCYDNYFQGIYGGANPRNQNSGATNVVLKISGEVNAHSEGPYETNALYSQNLSYGDLSCVLTQAQSCSVPGFEYSPIVSLSNNKNAHLALGYFYNFKLCCKSSSNPPICNYNGVCEGNENRFNCPDDCIAGPKIFSFDYEGPNNVTQSGWIPVLAISYNPGAGRGAFGWDPGIISAGKVSMIDSGNVAVPPPVNANRDYHKVSASDFFVKLNSDSPVSYNIDVYSGSATENSGPFDITAEEGTSSESTIATNVQTSAGTFLVSKGEVNVSDGELHLHFEHTTPIAIGGLVISSFCGDGATRAPEECDDASLPTGGGFDTGKRAGSAHPLEGRDAGACIVDLYPDGLMCERAVCGDGYLSIYGANGVPDGPNEPNPDDEECDLGAENGIEGSGCSNECKITGGPIYNERFCDSYREFLIIAPGEGSCPNGGNGCFVSSCSEYNSMEQKPPQYRGNLGDFIKDACIIDCDRIGGGDPSANGADPAGLIGWGCGWDSSITIDNKPAGGNGVPDSCYFWYEGGSGPICKIETISEGICEEGSLTRTVTINSTLVSGTGVCDAGCGPGQVCDREIPCSNVLQFPFFTTFNFIIAVLAVLFIYLFHSKIKRRINDK